MNSCVEGPRLLQKRKGWQETAKFKFSKVLGAAAFPLPLPLPLSCCRLLPKKVFELAGRLASKNLKGNFEECIAEKVLLSWQWSFKDEY